METWEGTLPVSSVTSCARKRTGQSVQHRPQSAGLDAPALVLSPIITKKMRPRRRSTPTAAHRSQATPADTQRLLRTLDSFVGRRTCGACVGEDRRARLGLGARVQLADGDWHGVAPVSAAARGLSCASPPPASNVTGTCPLNDR